MNGAESLVKTMLASGVNVCFANPGTSEMHFVAALDSHPDMVNPGECDFLFDQVADDGTLPRNWRHHCSNSRTTCRMSFYNWQPRI